MDPIFSQQFSMPQVAPKAGGMFGNADWTQALQAALAGYMARQNPQASKIVFDSLQQKRQQAQQEAQYNRERADKRDDFVFQNEYEAAHPKPVNNDTVADYNFIMQQLGPEGAKRYLETKTNPIVMTPMGPMPYSQVNPPVPTAPVGKLTPINEGGPAGVPPVPFPGRYY